MGNDLVTWAPRRGDSGDDLYDVPDDTPVGAGDASGFSATPTIDQINASSGLNQVIGLANRRVKIFNARFGVTMPTEGYASAETSRSAAKWAAVCSRINAIRVAEGFGDYTFLTAEAAAGLNIRRQHILDMRKALRIAGILSYNYNANYSGTPLCLYKDEYRRQDSPYPTGANEGYVVTTGYYGKETLAGVTRRYRLLVSYPIHEWVIAGALAAAFWRIRLAAVYTTLESVEPAVYSSNTDDSAYPAPVGDFDGVAYNLTGTRGQLEGLFTTTTGVDQDVAINTGRVESKAGARFSIIVGTEKELTGTGIGGGSGTRAEFVTATNGDGSNRALKLDFGS